MFALCRRLKAPHSNKIPYFGRNVKRTAIPLFVPKPGKPPEPLSHNLSADNKWGI